MAIRAILFSVTKLDAPDVTEAETKAFVYGFEIAETMDAAGTWETLVPKFSSTMIDPNLKFVVVRRMIDFGIRSPEGLTRTLLALRELGVGAASLDVDERILDTRKAEFVDALIFIGQLRSRVTSHTMRSWHDERNDSALPRCANCHDKVVKKASSGGHLRDPRTGEPGICTRDACGCVRYAPESELLRGGRKRIA